MELQKLIDRLWYQASGMADRENLDVYHTPTVRRDKRFIFLLGVVLGGVIVLVWP